MKLFLLTLSAICLLLPGAHASAVLVKEKAKQQRDINNEQQGIAPAAPAPAAAGTPQAPAPSSPQSMDPAQQALITHVDSDLAAIKTTATPEQKTALQNDLSNLAKGATKPSKPEVAKLANDLAAALAGKTVPAKSLTQLARDINIVENCAALTLPRTQTFVTDAQTILKAAGVSDETVQAVVADLKAIVTDIQKSKPKLYQ